MKDEFPTNNKPDDGWGMPPKPEEETPSVDDSSQSEDDNVGDSIPINTSVGTSSEPAPFVAAEVEPSTSAPAVGNNVEADSSASSLDTEPASAVESTQDENLTNVSEADTVAHDNTPDATPQAQASPSSEPVTPAQPLAATGTTPPKKKKKTAIIAAAIIGVLVLLGGGGAAAYNLWYQNPDKVLSDAFVNAITAKSATYNGSFDITMKETEDAFGGPVMENMKVTLDGKSNSESGEVNLTIAAKYDGNNYSVKGSGLVDKDMNIFVKVDDVRELLDQFIEEADSDITYQQLPVQMREIVEKVDSKWIRISSDDLDEYSEDASRIQKCVTDAVKNAMNDKAASDELKTIYLENKFVTVKEKLTAKDGSLGYLVDFDETKAGAFSDKVVDSKIGKAIIDCDESLKPDNKDSTREESDEDDATYRTEIWVDRWSHQLTGVMMTIEDDEAKGVFDIATTFNEEVTVDAPTDFISLTELQEDIEAMMNSFIAPTPSPSGVGPVNPYSSSMTL